MSIELNVFTYDFERIGTIEHYSALSIERNYYQRSVLELDIEVTDETVKLLQKHHVLTTATNINYGYIITHFSYTDNEEGERIKVFAYSLNHLFDWRTIIRQERYSGNAETILKQLISNQCITTNANRIIPHMVLAENSGIDISDELTVTGKNLEEYTFEFCQKHEMTVDVLMNHTTKKYEVYTWKGQDLSEGVAENAVKFSKEFENVTNIEFVNDELEFRSTAYVAGEGEGKARELVIVNDEVTGLNRKEVFIDARDLQSTYTKDDVEVTIPVAEYRQSLRDRGLEKLAEMNVIETFEGEVIDTQFKYGIDYSLGDVVSFRSERLNRILHTRVTSALITVDGNGKIDLKVSFGNKIPTLLEKIKKAVKK